MPIRLELTTPPEGYRPDDPTGLLATEQEETDLQEGRVLNRAGRIIRSLFSADFDPLLHPRNRRGEFIETPDAPQPMRSPNKPQGMASPAPLGQDMKDVARLSSKRTAIRRQIEKGMASPAAKSYTPDEIHEARVIAGLAHWVRADDKEHSFFGTARAGEVIDSSLDPHNTAAALYYELKRQAGPSPTLFRGQPIGTPPPDAETVRSWSASPIVALSFVEIGVDSDGYGTPLTLITQNQRQDANGVWNHKDSLIATGLEWRDIEFDLYVDDAATATGTMQLLESLDFTEAKKFPVLMQYIESGWKGPEDLKQSLQKLIVKEREFLQTSPAAQSITLKATAQEIRNYFQKPESKWREWGKLMGFNVPVTHHEGTESILPLFIDKLEQQLGPLEEDTAMQSPAPPDETRPAPNYERWKIVVAGGKTQWHYVEVLSEDEKSLVGRKVNKQGSWGGDNKEHIILATPDDVTVRKPLRWNLKYGWLEEDTGMQSPMQSPAGGWTATEEQDHPVYPASMTGKKGEKVRVGDLLTLDGKEWEVAHVLQGKVVLDEASGKKNKVEVRVVDPKDTPGKPTELGGAKPSKAKKIVKGGKQTMHEGSNVRMVDPYVEPSTHDPTIALPEGSALSEDQWEQFGLIEQMHYIDVMQRFGKWKSGAPIKAMVKQIEDDFDAEIVNLVKQAHQSQYGSSTGGTLSLASYSGTGEEGEALLKKRSQAMDLQGRLRDLYAWDLYNRTRSPSLTVFHGSTDSPSWWKKLFKERWVFSGLSQSFNIDSALAFGSTIVATPLSMRHIVLATTVNNWLGMYAGEKEIAIVPQMRVDSKRSMVFKFGDLSQKAKKFLQIESKQPRAGSWLERLRAHINQGADLPIVIPPEIIMSDKSLKPPPPKALKAFEDYEKLPKIQGEQYTPKELKEQHGDLPFKHIDEETGEPQALVAAEASIKPGDFMIGMKGTLYWIGPDKTNNFGLRYHKIVQGSDGKLMFDGESFAFEGDGANTYYFLKGNVEPLKDKTTWDPQAWQFAAEDPVMIKNMQVGDKFKVDGTPYELITTPSSMSISEDRATIRDLETGIQGTINADFATTRLVPATGYVAGQTLQPAKGMTLAYQGKKHTITSVKKDGVVSVKPAGGTVVQLAPDDPALKDLFDPSAWLPQGETTLQNLSVGEMFHGGSGKIVRPYKVIGTDGKKIEWQNMDNGKKGTSPKTKKVTVLKPQAGTAGEAEQAAPIPPPAPEPESQVNAAGVTQVSNLTPDAAKIVAETLLNAPSSELKVGTVLNLQRADGTSELYQVKKVNNAGTLLEEFTVGEGKTGTEVDNFVLQPNETLGDFFNGDTEEFILNAMKEGDQLYLYDTQPYETDSTATSIKSTKVENITDEQAAVVGNVLSETKPENLKTGTEFLLKYPSGEQSVVRIGEIASDGSAVAYVLDTDNESVADTFQMKPGDTLKTWFPAAEQILIYTTGPSKGPAQEKVVTADETFNLPEASIEPYKSAYGSGGKYKHDKISEMPVGTIFQDKTGKLWAVQVDGANAVITDGKANFKVDGDLRGKALSMGQIEHAIQDEFALATIPAPPEPAAHPYPETSNLQTPPELTMVPNTKPLGELKVGTIVQFSPEGKLWTIEGQGPDGNIAITANDAISDPWPPSDVPAFVSQETAELPTPDADPVGLVTESLMPNDGTTVQQLIDLGEGTTYYSYKDELFMIVTSETGISNRYKVSPDGSTTSIDTIEKADGETIVSLSNQAHWHPLDIVPEAIMNQLKSDSVMGEPAPEFGASGGELMKNMIPPDEQGYVEIEFEANGKPFQIVAVGKKPSSSVAFGEQNIFVKDMTDGEVKQVALTDTLTTEGVARVFEEPPPVLDAETVDTGGIGPTFSADEVAAAPKIELNFYKSAYGSGGKYKHEKLADVSEGATFTVKGDKSQYVLVKSVGGGWVLVWKKGGTAADLGLVQENERVRLV